MLIIRKVLKKFFFILALVLMFPLIVIEKGFRKIHIESVFATIGTVLCLFPGRIGSYLRVAYYRGTLDKMDSNVLIGFGTFFSKKNCRIEKNVNIGAYCILGSTCIGKNVQIASRVSIVSGKNQHGSSKNFKKDEHIEQFHSITIGKESWIGEGVIVMADIGEKCIIGSGSVVNKPISDNSLAVGNPARVIRSIEK